MSKSNPLSMRQIEPGGPFVLPPMLCTKQRADYFRRGNRILATYSSLAAYAQFGKEALEVRTRAKGVSDATPFRIQMADYVMQTTFGQLKKSLAGAGAQLTNQVFLMVYGNFEAYFYDLVNARLSQLGVPDAHQEAVNLLINVNWKGKIDRVAQKLSIKLPRRKLREMYEDIDMGFLGQPYSDPADYLQGMADLRHRLIHSAGRADDNLVTKYPDSGLEAGDPIQLPFGLPYAVSMFYVPITEFLDAAFAQEFSWERDMTALERLVD